MLRIVQATNKIKSRVWMMPRFFIALAFCYFCAFCVMDGSSTNGMRSAVDRYWSKKSMSFRNVNMLANVMIRFSQKYCVEGFLL